MVSIGRIFPWGRGLAKEAIIEGKAINLVSLNKIFLRTLQDTWPLRSVQTQSDIFLQFPHCKPWNCCPRTRQQSQTYCLLWLQMCWISFWSSGRNHHQGAVLPGYNNFCKYNSYLHFAWIMGALGSWREFGCRDGENKHKQVLMYQVVQRYQVWELIVWIELIE